MFYGCTKLVDAPVIAARKLTQGAFTNMFNGCTSLKNVKVSFSDWLGESTALWLKDVAPAGNIDCPSDLSIIIDESHIPTGWTINGKNLNITLSIDLTTTEVMQNEDMIVTCSSNIPCSVVVFVDDNLLETITVKTASAIKLPTDITGHHNVRIAIDGNSKVEKKFSYTVTSPDTPVPPSEQVPSSTIPDLSGEDL